MQIPKRTTINGSMTQQIVEMFVEFVIHARCSRGRGELLTATRRGLVVVALLLLLLLLLLQERGG